MLLSAVPNPDYMNGTMIVTPEAYDEGEAELIANAAYGDGYGMGTTGSLGVNYAAPLTRGGFPGELFFAPPMPTGNWKDAPTPVMLGTEGGLGIGSILLISVRLVASVAIYYGAYKYYSGLWKARKRTANPSRRRRAARRARR